ncbi:MAG: hypothetical protein QM820_41785 [Minicystis sp.]
MRFASIAASLTALSLAGSAAAQDPPSPLPPADLPPDTPAPPAPPTADKPPPAPSIPPAAEPQAAEPPAAPPAAPRRDDVRTLKGHAFRPPVLLDSAFVATYVDLSVSLGREVSPGIHVLATNAVGVSHELDYDAAASVVTGRLQAGVRFLDRLEVGVDAAYAGYIASDQTSALLFGGQSAFDLRPGLRVAALQSPSTGTQLGVRAYGVFTGSNRLSPARVLAEVAREIDAIAADDKRTACLQTGDLACALDQGFDALAAMKISRATYGGGLSASVAQAFGSRFGVQATAGVEVARASSSSPTSTAVHSTPFSFHAGLAPSLDLAPTVPLGISAEYRFDYATETFSGGAAGASTSTSTLKHGVAAGLYYTGRRDLVVGAGFVGSFASLSSDAGDLPGTNVLSGFVTMRYYF